MTRHRSRLDPSSTLTNGAQTAPSALSALSAIPKQPLRAKRPEASDPPHATEVGDVLALPETSASEGLHQEAVLSQDADALETASTTGDALEAVSAPSRLDAQSDDDRDRGVAIWGLAGIAGATALALVGRGGGASVQAPSPLPPTGGLPGSGDGASPGGPALPDTPGAGVPVDPPISGDPQRPLPPASAPPRAGQVLLQLADDTGASALDRITSNGSVRLDLVGADAGTLVRYQHSTDHGVTWQDCSTTPGGLGDGSHWFRALVSREGAESATRSVAVTVDTQAPDVADLVVTHTPGRPEVQLSVAGAEPGTSVQFEVSTDQGLTWQRSADRPSSLADGSYWFRGVITDAAGNQSWTDVESLTVDTVAPAPEALQLRKVGEQGFNALSPLSSTGNVDLLLQLPPGTQARYQVSADAGQTWTEVSAAVRGLPEGDYSFRAILQDAAGNETVLASIPLTVDTTPFPDFRIYAELQAGSGDAMAGYLSTTGNYQIILERASFESSISTDVRLLGTTTWQPGGPGARGMLDGQYEYRVRFKDAAGNATYSNVLQIEVDTRKAGAGTITLDNFNDTGWNAFDRITADNTFDLIHRPSGLVSALSWEVSTNGGASWTATTAQQTRLVDGAYEFRAQVLDDQGVTHTTRSIQVQIDARPPHAPTLVIEDLEDTGPRSDDRITQSGKFNLSVQNLASDAAESFEVSRDGKSGWLLTTAQQDLSSGTYWFRSSAVDASGGRGLSQVIKVVVDREAPAAGQLMLDDLADTGIAGDRITSDTGFTLVSPEVEDGATVTHWHSSDGGQTWMATGLLQQNLSDGDHWYRCEVTDLAGNRSIGPAIVVTVDTMAPDAGQLRPTAGLNGGLDLHWTGSDTVASVDYQVSLDQGQSWLPVLAHTESLMPGDYLFRAVVSDVAGNTATTQTVAWQVDASEDGASSAAAPDAGFGRNPIDGSQAFASTEVMWAHLWSTGVLAV